MGVPFKYVPDPVPSVAPTEAGDVAPSSSAPPASVSGPEEDHESAFRAGVQSPADYTTALKTQEGVLGLSRGETAKYAGRVGHDVRKIRNDLQTEKFKQLSREFLTKWGRGADQEELEQMQSEARVWASEQVEAKFSERRGMDGNELFIDIDPKGRIEALSKWADESYVGRAIAPLWAAGLGIDVEFRETKPDDPNQPERITYNEGDAWGFFDWLTRMSPGTQLATTAVAAGLADESFKDRPFWMNLITEGDKVAEAYGSEEHITNIMEGRDLFSEADRLNLSPVPPAITNLASPITERIIGLEGEQVADYTTALLVSFLDPDVFSLFGSVGDVGKIVGKGLQKIGAAKHIPGTTAWTDAKIDMFKGATEQAEIALDAALDAGKTDEEAFQAAYEALRETGLEGNPLKENLVYLVASRTRTGTPASAQARGAKKAREVLLEHHRKEYGEGSAIYQAALADMEARATTGTGPMSTARIIKGTQEELDELKALKDQKAEEIAQLEKGELRAEEPAPEVAEGAAPAPEAPKPDDPGADLGDALRNFAEEVIKDVPIEHLTNSGNVVEDANDFLTKAIEVLERSAPNSARLREFKAHLQKLEENQLFIFEKYPDRVVELLSGRGSDYLKAVEAEDAATQDALDRMFRGMAEAAPRSPAATAKVPPSGPIRRVRAPDADARIETLRSEIVALTQKETEAMDRMKAAKKVLKKQAMAKAGDAAPIPADDIEAAVHLSAAQIKHYEAVADYQQALGLQKMLRKMGAGVSEGAKRARAARIGDVAPRLVELDEEMGRVAQEAQEFAATYSGRSPGLEPAVTRTPDELEAAKAGYHESMRKLQVLGSEYTRLLGAVEAKTIDDLVAQTGQEVADATKILETMLEDAKGRKGLKKTAEKSQALHMKAVGKLGKAAEQMARDRIFGEFRNALHETSTSFDALRTGEQGSDIAAQIMRQAQEGWRVYDDWGPLKPLQAAVGFGSRAMATIIEPARSLFNVDDPDVLEAAVDAMGDMKFSLGELTEAVSQFESQEDRIAVTLKFLTDAETALPKRDGATSANTGRLQLDGTHAAVWDDAVPVLKHLANTAKEAGEVPKAVMALARMYSEGAAARMAHLGPGAVKKALEESAGDIDQFMARMQEAVTIGRVGVPRKVVFDEVIETVKLGKGDAVEYVDMPVQKARYETLDEAVARIKTSPDFDEAALARQLTEEGKAHRILATAALHARTLSETSERMMGVALKKVALTAEGGEVLAENSPEGRAALQRAVNSMVAMADPSKTDPAGYRDALALFEALGMRADQLKAFTSAKEAVITGVTSVGDRAVVPRSLINEMEKELDTIVKSLDAFKAEDLAPMKQAAVGFLKRVFHLYNASLVTGLLFPKISHFSAITFGNFGQVWADEGLTTAVKVQAESIADFAPAISRYLPRGSRKVREGMSESLGVPVGNVLPTAQDVVLNPDLAKFMDPALAPASTKVRLPDGTEMTFGQLRRLARQHGVLSSFISTTGLQEALVQHNKTSKWGRGLAALGAPKRLYADVADAFEQRQRVSMFLDLITRKGVSPEEAARRTKNALYDWNYPMTWLEKEFLSQVMMFWTFQRKALGQGARILSAPFRDATMARNTGGFAAAAMGQEASSFGRFKDMNKTVAATQEAQRQAIEDDELKQVYPWWAMRAGSREWMYTERMDPAFADSVKKATGKTVTHEAYTLPAFTPLEMVNTYFSLIEASLAADSLTGMVEDPMRTFAGDAGGRTTTPAMVAVIDALTGRQEEKWLKTGGNEYAIMDRMMVGAFNSLGLLEASNDAKTDGAVRLTPAGQAAYALATPLSYETINFFEPLMEAAHYDQSVPEAVLRAMRQYTGIYKSYYYNPAKIKEGDLKAVDKHAGALERELKRQDPFTFTAPKPQ